MDDIQSLGNKVTVLSLQQQLKDIYNFNQLLITLPQLDGVSPKTLRN